MLGVLLRVSGVNALATWGARLPSESTRAVVAGLLIVMNLLPILGAIIGSVGAGDLFALYWFENVVVMAVTLVQIKTATGAGDGRPSPITTPGVDQESPRALGGYFLRHYGAFTGVHLVFTAFVVIATDGLRAGPDYWIAMVLVVLLSHLWVLGIDWFGRDGRASTSPVQALVAPYPRVFVLQVALIVSFGVILLTGGGSGLVAVLVLCVLKALLDLLLYFGPPIRIELS